MTNAFISFVRQKFSLKAETDYRRTIQRVRFGSQLHSGNIWALICAIVIASIGLNINSVAVIIGAMLISPLMGPIIGTGFGIAVNDFALLKQSLRNLALAAILGVSVSAIYFWASPFEGSQSELLSRIRPSLYDVLIAFFSGVVGMVAISRKNILSNVVPGVAIATALMPPICTAGFGLSHGNIVFFLGAFYLFLINALFICLATIVCTLLMNFRKVEELEPEHVFRTSALLVILTSAVAIPSIYTAWNMVHETRFEQMAKRFISDNLNYGNRVVVDVNLHYSRGGSTISAKLLGKPLPADSIYQIEQRLTHYGLTRTQLRLTQLDDQKNTPAQIEEMIRKNIFKDLHNNNEEAIKSRDVRIKLLEEEITRLHSHEYPVREITGELSALYPELYSVTIGQQVSVSDSSIDNPSIAIIATWHKSPQKTEILKLKKYLSQRLSLDTFNFANIPKK